MDADGFSRTYPATAAKQAGRYHATVIFPRAGQCTYAIRDGAQRDAAGSATRS